MTKEKWNGRQLLVGIDIGSTTTKVVATDKAGEEILYTDYRRHHANQVQSVICVLKQLNERFPAARIRLALTGSGAKSIADRLGLPFVQEVVANSIALREKMCVLVAFISSSKLAAAMGVSHRYLLQISAKLRVAGFIRAAMVRLEGWP